MPSEGFWLLLVGGLLCILGALGGMWAERRRLQFVIADQAARNSDLSRRLTEQDHAMSEVSSENQALSTFLVVLPDVVRRLNSNIARRGIPPLLASTLDHIFEPSQILVFLAQGENEMALACGKGLSEGMEPGMKILHGQGRIGLAAMNQRTMDREDFLSESRMRHSPGDVRDPGGALVELVSPMVNEGRTLGVLCVGRPARRHRDEKRMIKLVADLGALALQNQNMISSLESMANKDALTGLCTKRFLNLRLGHLLHRAQQTHTPLSVIIFDIDHFKKFNDSFGHLAGDEVLRKVGAVLKAQLRSDDTPARYGGEEFVVVLPDTAKEDAMTTAEKIRRAIEAAECPLPGGHQARVTISGGVAALSVDGRSSHELMSAADQALYLAKEQGRNRIVAYRNRYLSEEGPDPGMAIP